MRSTLVEEGKAALRGGDLAGARRAFALALAEGVSGAALEDVLGCLDVELPAEHLAELDEVSRVELGFPYELLMGPQGRLVYGDLEPRIELPSAAPIRWR